VLLALLDPTPASGDRASCLLLERPIEGIDLAARPAEPLLHGGDDPVDLCVDVRLRVVGVLEAEGELVIVDARPRRVGGELVRTELEHALVAGVRDADDHAVASDAPVGGVDAEVSAGIAGVVDLHVLGRLALHLVDLEIGCVDAELVG
jgi:hypothetical protein